MLHNSTMSSLYKKFSAVEGCIPRRKCVLFFNRFILQELFSRMLCLDSTAPLTWETFRLKFPAYTLATFWVKSSWSTLAISRSSPRQKRHRNSPWSLRNQWRWRPWKSSAAQSFAKRSSKSLNSEKKPSSGKQRKLFFGITAVNHCDLILFFQLIECRKLYFFFHRVMKSTSASNNNCDINVRGCVEVVIEGRHRHSVRSCR